MLELNFDIKLWCRPCKSGKALEGDERLCVRQGPIPVHFHGRKNRNKLYILNSHGNILDRQKIFEIMNAFFNSITYLCIKKCNKTMSSIAEYALFS